MLEMAGAYEKYAEESQVVSHVSEHAAGDGLGHGADGGERCSDSEKNQHWSPRPTQLRRMHYREQKSGNDDAKSDACGARDYGITA